MMGTHRIADKEKSNSSVNATLDSFIDDISDVEGARNKVNLLMLDFLIKQGFQDAALAFAREAQVDVGSSTRSLTDLLGVDQMPSERVRIRDLIVRGRIVDAMAAINECAPTFLEEHPSVHMDLLHLVLVELIRAGHSEDALQFAQDDLAKRQLELYGDIERYERTMALLAYDEPEKSPFRDVLDADLRRTIASQVADALLRWQGVDPHNQITKLMKMIVFLQDELDKCNVKYPKVTDFSTAALAMSDQIRGGADDSEAKKEN